MVPIVTFFGTYGVASTFYFSVQDVAASSSNRFINAAVPWIAGDVKVSLDGGAVANIGTLPTRVGSTPLYVLSLTAAEMSATWVAVYLVDADGPAWRDTLILINTRLKLGTVLVDATQVGGNTDAVEVKGVGTGYGLKANGASAAYYANLFLQLEGAEPTSSPADNATIGAILQHLKRRWFNKNTQTSSVQSHYKDDSTTVASTQVVSDDGTTQTVAKAS